MTKQALLLNRELIYFERLLPGPIERVWAYLTESEKRGKWLAAGEIDMRVGGKIELTFNHENLTPHREQIPQKYKNHAEGSTMKGQITQLNPPRLLSYTWAEASGESEVTFELTPKGDEVLLKLTHRRLGDEQDTLISVAAGWHTHLGILVDKLYGRSPKGFWSVHARLEKEYKNSLAEN